jgi:hypothetical protein
MIKATIKMGQNEIDIEIVTMMYEHILTTLIYQNSVLYKLSMIGGEKKVISNFKA